MDGQEVHDVAPVEAEIVPQPHFVQVVAAAAANVPAVQVEQPHLVEDGAEPAAQVEHEEAIVGAY